MFRRVLLVGVIAVLASQLFDYLYRFGFFKTIYNHEPGPCRVVPGIVHGSEDITVTSDGLAFISSGIRGKGNKSDPTIQPPLLKGRIFLFDFNHPEKNAAEVPLLGDFDRDNFYPHGISLYEDSISGETRLFVINHHISDEDRIEIFRFDGKKRVLNHLKSVTGENIYHVNDLVASGPETFYYTVDTFFTTSMVKKMEMYGGLLLGKIGMFDGSSDKILTSGYRFPNGINLSLDGRYLYVATLIPGVLIIFERKEDGSIEEVQRISLNTGLDNIEVDKKTGELWIGCHPILHILWEHEKDYSKPAAAQVLRLRPDTKSAPYDEIDIREVFMNDGSLIKGSTVASHYDNKMLIGTVVDKVAYCEINAF
ncbi:serum paraoxonase/arylesterase 1-like [Glandiceps talaboti]